MTMVSDSSPSSVLSLSSISYKWIPGSSPRVLSQNVDLPLGLAIEALTYFRLMVLAVLFRFLKHKSVFNPTSGININMPHLRKLWLQRTSASVL